MSARLVWLVACEVCETVAEHDGALGTDALGDAIRSAGWQLPVYGGTFCARCARAVRELSRRA